MSASFVFIILFLVIVFVCIAAVIGIFVYDRQKKKRLSTEDENNWLFGNFQETVFNLCYGKAKGDVVCGLNLKDYDRYCRIIHKKNNYHQVVALRIEGVAIFLIACMISMLLISGAAIVAGIIVFAGTAILFAMWEIPYQDVKGKAEDRLFNIENDMPRFLSLMEKAMDLPIDQAMLVTAEKFNSPLADDIVDSINKVKLGANGWQETLYDLAKLYDIEAFSDLILEIINAYEQGVDIRHLVDQKISEVEEDRMYAVEAHDSRIKTMIFLPILVFEVLPLMVLICMPMLTMYM